MQRVIEGELEDREINLHVFLRTRRARRRPPWPGSRRWCAPHQIVGAQSSRRGARARQRADERARREGYWIARDSPSPGRAARCIERKIAGHRCLWIAGERAGPHARSPGGSHATQEEIAVLEPRDDPSPYRLGAIRRPRRLRSPHTGGLPDAPRLPDVHLLDVLRELLRLLLGFGLLPPGALIAGRRYSQCAAISCAATHRASPVHEIFVTVRCAHLPMLSSRP